MYALICFGADQSVKIVSQNTLRKVKNVNAKLIKPTVDEAREIVGRDDILRDFARRLKTHSKRSIYEVLSTRSRKRRHGNQKIEQRYNDIKSSKGLKERQAVSHGQQ